MRARRYLIALTVVLAAPTAIASADTSSSPGLPVIWNSAGIVGLTTADLGPSLYAMVPTPFTVVVPTGPLPATPVAEPDSEYAFLALNAPKALDTMPQGLAEAYKTLPAETSTRVMVVVGVPAVSGPGIATNTSDGSGGSGSCADPNNCEYYTIAVQVSGGGLKCVGPSFFGFCLTGSYLPTLSFTTDQSYELATDQSGRTDQIASTTSHFFDNHNDNWTGKLKRTTVQGNPATFDAAGSGDWAPVDASLSIPGGAGFDISPTVTVTSDFCLQDVVSVNGNFAGIDLSGFQGDFGFTLFAYTGGDQIFSDDSCGVA